MSPLKRFILLTILCLFICSYFDTWRKCVKVIDGDTIKIDQNEIVRLIGVDSPESKDPDAPIEYFAEEALQFTKKLVEGKNVKLEFDFDRIDTYGRTLAYIFLEDGTFVNAEIIKYGYGYAYKRFPFKYLDEFVLLEKKAQEKKSGLWSLEMVWMSRPNLNLF